MTQRSITAVIAMAFLLAISNASMLSDIRDGSIRLVRHDGSAHAAPSAAQQKARDRLGKQHQLLKKMHVDQSQLTVRQQNLKKQLLQRQSTRSRQLQIQTRQRRLPAQ